MINAKIWLVPATCMMLLTSGCGEDDSGSESAAESYGSFNGELAEGGGLITGFGSVVIDGISYQTTGADFEDEDGASISEDTLAVGMRVDFEAKLKESDDTGFLRKLVIRDQVCGKLDSADVTAQKIYIFGDEILYNDDTVLANFDSENLMAELLTDVHVSVSGYRDSTGVLTATLIRKKDPSYATSKMEGTISGLNKVAKTFEMRGITFKYQDGQDPDQKLADGKVVKITFASYDSTAPSTSITGLKFAKSETRELVADRKLVMRGSITSLDKNTTSFTIGKVPVKYSADTEYQVGTSDDLDNDNIVVVTGTIVDNNNTKVLNASEIMFHKYTSKYIEGKITIIENEATGKYITVDGEEFELTRRAQISNNHKNKGKKVFDSLAVGDFVAISYHIDSETNHKLVTKLKRVDTTSDGFDADTTTYKATLNDLTIADDNSTITYKEVQYNTTQVQILNQFGDISTVSGLKNLKTNHGTWNVLLTVKKAAGDSGHAVQVIEVKALPSANISTFVFKFAQKNNAAQAQYDFSFGKGLSLTINSSTTVLQAATVYKVTGMSFSQLDTTINDNSAVTAINTARHQKDAMVKLTGTMSGSNFTPEFMFIYSNPEDVHKHIPHSLDERIMN